MKYHYAIYLGGDSDDRFELVREIYSCTFTPEGREGPIITGAKLNLGDGFGNISFYTYDSGNSCSFSTIARLPNKVFQTLSKKWSKATIIVLLLFSSSLSLWVYSEGKNCIKASFPCKVDITDEMDIGKYMLRNAGRYFCRQFDLINDSIHSATYYANHIV
jgi:hypothetical protein